MAVKDNNVKIRLMDEADVDAIVEIDKAISGMERAFTYEYLFDGLIGGEIACSFIAEVDEKVVGFLLAAISYVPEVVTEVCMIQILGVHPGYRRRGIAKKLVDALVNDCDSKGIRTIRVMIDQYDTQLQGLFETLEFQRGNVINYFLALPQNKR